MAGAALWLWRGQDRVLLPDLNDQFASGAPASAPPLAVTQEAWRAITSAADGSGYRGG